MVRKSLPVVVWNNRASASFKKAYEHIKEDSYSNAEKVRVGITKIVDGLPGHPEKYAPDKYKKNNKGHYRAFEKYSHRIAYKIKEKEIRILRIRHVKQEPKEY
jgi:plasmid stabilization system protein ParE